MRDSLLEGWDQFHFMTGSAASALIGLLFVVITLTRSRAARAVATYVTPTVLHFVAVMTTSAVALMPRLPMAVLSGAIGVFALGGLIAGLFACVRMLVPRAGAEPPHWSDFWLYGVAPVAAYLALGGACVALARHASWAAHLLGFVILALLLVGIRNAWDLVTWLAPRQKEAHDGHHARDSSAPPAADGGSSRR